jgi:predicted site-specific integrase-resolvase
VSLVVAAAFLEVDRRTLRKYLDEGLIAYEQRRSRRRVAVAELAAFAQRTHHPRRLSS